MVHLNTTKKTYERLKSCLPDLIPNVRIDVLVMDENLERLGFCESAPCELAINLNRKDLEDLLDELIDIETIACDGYHYDYGNRDYARYEKYGWMYDVFYYVEAED